MKISKTLFLAFIFTCLICKKANAAISYSFVASSGAFTANSTPTSLTSGDDALSSETNIGFNFNFGGCTSSTYTTFKASTNGWFMLGNASLGTYTSNMATDDLTYNSYGPIIAPLWDDLSSGSVNYKLTGSAPNRILTIEWLNAKWNWGASIGISFQVKLYETSNKIEFIYRQEAGSVSSGSASIGIHGFSATDYYSLNGTGTAPIANYGTKTDNLNTKPATGQIYTFNAPSTMAYTSSAVIQPTTSNVFTGTSNQEVIGVTVTVSGGCSPFNVTQLIFSMTGTTALSDVTNVDIYYSGTSNIFNTSTLFGSAAPASGNITINGTQALQEGVNYFWIAYDISSSATLLDFIDAGCSQITVNGVNRTPTGNPPAGNRQIAAAPNSFSKWIEKGWARSVITDGGSNLVWAGGTTNTYSSGSSDIYIVKTDINATTIIWSAVIGGNTNSERASDIVKTSDGYVVVGYTQSFGAGGWDIIVSKVNLSGVHQWTKTIGLPSSTDEGTSIILTSDGNVAICGTIYYSTWSENLGYFAKINQTDGTIIQEKYLDGTGSPSQFNDLIQTSDGGYLLVGKTNNTDFYMVKLSSTYTVDFGKTWGGANNDELIGAIENSANNYTVFGSTYSYGSGSRDGYAMRFTASGATITNVWTKAYGSATTNSFNSVTKVSDGNYALTGVTTRIGDNNDNEAWFTKIQASDGSALMFKSIGTTDTGEDQEGYGITIDSNGDYVIGGLHYNTVGTNFYLMKVASSGYSCASIQDNGATTNLTAPTLTNTTSATTSPASTKSSPAPSTNTGGVIVEGCMTTTPILLPIQLINFDGKAIEEYNHVFWETQSERENDYFTVEKSANGLEWEILGNVDGAGNSIAELHYSFNDYHPYYPITYYKLKQTDFNGVYVYSDIIALTRTNSGDLFSLIYPNPTKDKFNFIYNGKKDSFELKIYNALGELIEQHSFDGKKNTEEVSLSAYSTGLYFVHFIQNQHTSIQKIIKN